jgi:hypothetical protein
VNLFQIRSLFRKESGRYDLVNAAGANTGADDFIRAGQRYLDMKVPMPEAVATIDLAAGQVFVAVENLRYIREVWFTSGEGSYPMEPIQEKNFKRSYPGLFAAAQNLLPGISNVHTPYSNNTETSESTSCRHYCRTSIIRAPRQNQLTSLFGGADEVGTILGDSALYNGLLLGPSPNSTSGLRIIGTFFNSLDNDGDVSFWSLRYPDLLLLATRMILERTKRNTEGVRDFVGALNDSLMEIQKDHILLDADHLIMEMGG